MPSIYFLPDDKKFGVRDGESIRDSALQNGIRIAHVCGGKARCSTCRVLVLEGLENCSPRSDKEKNIARDLAFSPDIRLACQTKVKSDVKVRRLTLDEYDVELTSRFITGEQSNLAGVEKHVFIMFVDIRGFTTFSESLLPYDVIHILHRYFHYIDEAVTRHGGFIDNYMGDGFMALFEVESPEEGALSAVKAGLELFNVLKVRIKPYVEKLFGKAFEIKVGLHCGLVVAGTVGGSDYKKTMVIGDAVNFSSRIESANKQAGTRFLISKDVYVKVADSILVDRKLQLEIPGKTGIHILYEVVGLR